MDRKCVGFSLLTALRLSSFSARGLSEAERCPAHVRKMKPICKMENRTLNPKLKGEPAPHRRCYEAFDDLFDEVHMGVSENRGP